MSNLASASGALPDVRPDGQFIAAGIGEMESAPAGEFVGGLGDLPVGQDDAALDGFEV